MEKYYEQFKEILDEQVKKIAKKGDITPQELENVYKASAIVLDMETQKAMKKAEEQQKKQEEGGKEGEKPSGGEGASNTGYPPYARLNSRNAGAGYTTASRNYFENRSYEGGQGGQSNHYPWFMYGEGMLGDNMMMSNAGNSYAGIWNQDMENKSMHEVQSQENRRSNEGGMSNRRGVRGTGRGRGNSRDNSYEQAYEGAYDGAYDGSYEGSYDGSYEGSYDGSRDASNDNSYRRGRNQRTGRYTSRESRGGYSRAMDKERMIGKLEDMMDDAPSEKERRALEQCVEKLERQ